MSAAVVSRSLSKKCTLTAFKLGASWSNVHEYSLNELPNKDGYRIVTTNPVIVNKWPAISLKLQFFQAKEHEVRKWFATKTPEVKQLFVNYKPVQLAATCLRFKHGRVAQEKYTHDMAFESTKAIQLKP